MENFRIESLEINKIGAFEHIKMDFPKKTDPDKAEIHILTGENGTGKTTILHLLSHCVPYQEPWLLEKFHYHRDSLSNFDITINYFDKSIEIKKIDEYYFSNFSSNNSVITRRQMISKFQNLPQTLIHYPNLRSFSFALFAYSGYRRISDVKLEGIKPIKNNPLENALNFDKSINPNLFVQWVANTKAKFALSYMNYMQTPELFEEGDFKDRYNLPLKLIETTISKIIGKAINFFLEESPFEVKISVSESGITTFEHLPDGLKSIISWIGDLLMRLDNINWENNEIPINEQNFILFLDEIEVHLHPAWQRKILPVVQKLFKNAQIFISTHSPFVVGSVDGAWVHKLKKEGAYAVLDGEPVLSEDAESYDTILEEIFGIKERFGDEIELKLKEFKAITKEILKGDDLRMEEWDNLVSFFENQGRPDEIMSLITPQVRQINRIKNQVTA